uniref:Codeine 3-O-demethylase n=1 Tax=Opuntia streptacantha TaxID=393608 RepID=A0A7C8ZYY5_OPUST
MAESCTQEDMSAEKLLAKRVQDMVLQGEEDQLPSPYVCRKKDQYEDDDHAVNLAPIPIIDLNQAHVDPEELQSLKLALCSWGCFQAIGHGISSSLLNNIREVGKGFFEQPMEEKSKYAKKVEEFEGYGGDPPPEEGQPLDWQDRLSLDVYPHHRRKLHLWPENPSSFRSFLCLL